MDRKSDENPKFSFEDVENHLIHTWLNYCWYAETLYPVNQSKDLMQCYRQYVADLNFCKDGYIHKVTINGISPVSEHC